MDLRPDMSVGDRLKVARRYAGFSQEQLAERSGVHIDTIRKLEQNQRHSARVSTANSLAGALGIETTALLLGALEEGVRHDSGLLAVRRALVPLDDFTPPADVVEEDTPPDLDALRESVCDGWSNYHAGDFASLGATLPSLIGEARTATRELTNGRAAAAQAVLAKVLQLGSHVMIQHRMEDFGLLGLDRARRSAELSNDPLLPAMMSNSVAWVFLRTGRLEDSERVAVATADHIEPAFRSSAATHVAVYGGLLLSAMTAAARRQRYDTARELLNVARAAAQRIGDDSTDRLTTVFGPTSVGMQAVSVETAAGEWGPALQLAKQVPMTGKTPVSWAVRFLLDVAQAQSETYHDVDAVATLRTIKQLAPEWMRRHGLATAIIRELLGRPRRPRGITTLADFQGVTH
jgi:transcriptional regulator with XRE-family HTH domain